MRFRILYILLGLALNLPAQQFAPCKKGLRYVATTLFHDTMQDKLIVSGYYWYADGIKVNGMATWDGERFDSLGQGDKKPIMTTNAKFIHYKNKLYTMFYDGYIHRYDYNTKLWELVPGKFDGLMRGFTIYKNELIIVGEFFKVGNLKVHNLVKFDGTKFDTLAKPGFSGWLTSAEVYKDELYIAGHFSNFHPFGCIAKLGPAGNWTKASPDLVFNGVLEAWDLQVYNKKLFVCGKWAGINGEPMRSIASWDGNKWHGLGQGLSFGNGSSGAPGGMKVVNNKLFVAGSFQFADTIFCDRVAVWNDTSWCNTSVDSMPGITDFEYSKGHWYFSMGDLVFQGDTLSGIGRYIGNNGKLEGKCFDKAPTYPTVTVNPEGLYPNPTNDKVTFNLRPVFGENCELKITNQLGQLMGDFKSINPDFSIDLSPYPTGVYFFMFRGNDTERVYKVLKN